MTPLHTHLLTQLNKGPMPLENYMQQCLYHPQHGYYTTHARVGATATHDFLTAPTLTPLFGATVASWVAQQWQAMGQPTAFTLAEGGPGPTPMLTSLLPQLQHSHPACAAAAHPYLLETSPTLQQQQAQQLPTATTITHLHQLPPQPTVFVANELLDAFPINQYHILQGHPHHHHITAQGTVLQSIWLPTTHPIPTPFHEDSPTQNTFLQTLHTHLSNHTGASLLIDYGYTQSPTFAGGNTLQALQGHQKVSIFHQPGLTDLTAHVNFTQVLKHLGGTCTPLTTFLLTHGLLTLAEPTIHQPTTASAVHRLMHPGQMGTLFQVHSRTYA